MFCFFAGFNWTRDDIKNPDKIPLTYHRIVESLKFAYAPFTYLGDPKFTNHTKEVMKTFINKPNFSLFCGF